MSDRQERPALEDPAKYGFHLVLCLLFTVILVADRVAVAAAGWHITFLADARIQAVWAAPFLLAGAWPHLLVALRREWGTLFHLLIALAAAVLFTYGMYLTVGRPQLLRHDAFMWQALLLTSATLLRLMESLFRRYR